MSGLAVQSTNTELKIFIPTISSRIVCKLLSLPFSCNSSRKLARSNPSRLNMAFAASMIPTTCNFNPFSIISFCCWQRICSTRLPPTVPIPQIKRFKTWYSDRKKESWITFRDLRNDLESTTKEMLVSEAPCAQAITLIPLRPNVPKSLPAIPGVCFIFSPTIATVARFLSARIGEISPISISFANSSFSTSQARSASAFRTPIEVLFSDEACETRNTLIPFFAKALKMR